MRVFKTRPFNKWAVKEGLADNDLISAVNEMVCGLVDANLGGNLYKKRVALHGRGKSGGLRTLLAYRVDDSAFFIYGFAKNVRANIQYKELRALKLLAGELLSYGDETLRHAIAQGALIEVKSDE